MSDVLTPEDREFLRELGNELKTQDTGAQRKPMFIQVMEPVKEYGMDVDYADGTDLIIGEPCDAIPCSSVESAKEDLIENYEIDEERLVGLNSFRDIKDFCDENGIDCILAGYKDSYRLHQTFLTFSAYETHMRMNKHNYKYGTHSWMDSFFRNPQMERLIEIVEKFADVEG